MKNGNILSNSTEKRSLKKKAISKVNISKNYQLLNLPEFHFNRTLKAYINRKLKETNNTSNKMNLTENNPINKNQINYKQTNKYNNLCQIKTVTKLKKPKYNIIKKYYSKIKGTYTPHSEKKLYKSKSKYKLNISNYFINFKKKSNNKKINIKSKTKYLKNSFHKYHRNNESKIITNNLTNQPLEKSNSKYQKDNKMISNSSTLDIKNKRKPNLCVYSTSKKNKFNNQLFFKEKILRNKNTNLNKLKNKSNEIKNLIMKRKNINEVNTNLDSNFIRKSFNNQDEINNINLNYINNTENNINYTKTESNHIYFHDCNISDKTLSKIDNISNMNNKAIDINMNFINNKINNDIRSNNFNSNKDNSFKYIKKIEILENENKILKYEINDSKYKLQMLEDKINKLLIGKNSILNDKEECPQPAPYVKKYSTGFFKNYK